MGATIGAVFAYLFGGPLAELSGSDFAAWLSTIGIGDWFSGVDWENTEGWRIAFVVIGLPGVLIGLFVWAFIKEPPRG